MENLLYIFQFMVDDLLVTRPNCCAPEDYPTCVTISFRKSVYVHVCDREWGKCVDLCKPKCWKCVLFPLDSPITNSDQLNFHVYKKRDEKCKFLLGATGLPVKPIFDRVNKNFNKSNPKWEQVMEEAFITQPNFREPDSNMNANCNDCNHCDIVGRPEQFCPASTLSKHILPIFNMKKIQTGNLTILIRLECNGPTIASSYPFGRMCEALCPASCAESAEAPEENKDCTQADPCVPPPPIRQVCQRYFACNVDKGCPCSECEDYGDRECPSGCAKILEQEKQKKLLTAACACCPPPKCSPKKRKTCKSK